MLLTMSALYAQQALAEKQQHKEYAGTKLSECNDCHKGEGIAPNHGADWAREHRLLAGKAGNNCAQCHTQSYCLDCHQGGGINADLSTATFGRDYVPKSHRSDFIAIHPTENYYGQEMLGGRRYFTAVYPDLPMVATCIECHNRRSASTPQRYQVGDVMGGIVVRVPLEF